MTQIDEKEYSYLLHLLDGHDKVRINEFVSHSRVYFETQTAYLKGVVRHFPILTLKVDPETYKKYHSLIRFFKEEIRVRYGEIVGKEIHEVRAQPDLSKFQLLQNEIVPVMTPWERINELQIQLIGELRKVASTSNYQNIGNSSRILLQNLASIVFDPAKHTAPEGVALDEGKYKNRLHSYIVSELRGDQNKEIREYIDSIVVTTEKAVDLSNQVTHDTNTKYFFAEACVIGVVTTIGLIKLVSVAKKGES